MTAVSMTAKLASLKPVPISPYAIAALGAIALIGLAISPSCDSDSNNDGSSTKPASDAAGAEYDRRRDRE